MPDIKCCLCSTKMNEHFFTPLGETEYPEVVKDGRICDGCEFSLWDKDKTKHIFPKDPMDGVLEGFAVFIAFCLGMILLSILIIIL